MRDITVIAHDIRSSHNVGSLLRTADGLGISKVYFSGYTPYPVAANDNRLPHLAKKIDAAIAKTALGAEKTVAWEHIEDLDKLLQTLKAEGYEIVALEQAVNAMKLPDYRAPGKVAIILGREVEGIEPDLLAKCDQIVEIPMFGPKESFNVVQAAAMTMYQLRFAP
jgi:23S rRNA (guanosine2251-2'-O)-methyltransferase